MLIRGTNTVNGQYQPLYVIDGVIANNDAYPNGLNAITLAGPATPATLAGAGSVSQAGAAIVSVQDQQVDEQGACHASASSTTASMLARPQRRGRCRSGRNRRPARGMLCTCSGSSADPSGSPSAAVAATRPT